jgi:serine/threonine protein kinase
MDSGDFDKTRIAIPPLAQRRNEKGGASVRSDDAQTFANVDDRTRLNENLRSSAQGKQPAARVPASEPGSDATRYIAKPSVPADKTRIRTPEPQRPVTTAQTRVDTTDSESHEVLKGRFVLEKVLGAGGMGVVYKAKDLLKVEAQDRDPYVAIKVLSDEFKSHPEAFISLQRESRKSQRIAHPNIVNVHDFDRDGDTVFMTMEYMEGTPLDKLIKQYKATGLPTDDALTIIEGMSLALAHAHAENIVHSDFKPGNVFVTTKGLAKVFDFGISRAVAIAEQSRDNPEDRTIFDAGTLGALTPAYASLEMLQGEAPDVRDDIFALGCVAYEMLTGVHPYNRVPADEAEKQGLKPRRITSIKKHQWKAIEGAIALRREDRTASVEQFLGALSTPVSRRYRVVMAVGLLIALALGVYAAFFHEQTVDPMKEFNIRNELELKVKIEFYKDHLTSLLHAPSFDDSWQSAVWKDISDLLKLTRKEDPWVFEKKDQVYNMYLTEIDAAIKEWKLGRARQLLTEAKRYTDDSSDLDRRADALAKASAELEAKRASQAKAQSERPAAPARSAQAEPTIKKVDLFEMALANVNLQLKCQGRINMPDFESAINKLREVDHGRYKGLEPRIVAALGDCIAQIGKAFPARASEAKKHALRIFSGNEFLQRVEIKARDVCDVSLAGLGARGYRAICKDKLDGKNVGPELVVVPGKGNMPPFAIGKYEVTIREFNLFCKDTGNCAPIGGADDSLPAANIAFDVVGKYLRWLSDKSNQKYRLPTRVEWLHAGTARGKKLDPNRNCKLSARGIEKGDGPVRADIGAQNDWGLVNHVGNVQEWVYDKGRKLVAVGGSYSERMDSCLLNTVNDHSGSADVYTGFRVLREIRTTP